MRAKPHDHPAFDRTVSARFDSVTVRFQVEGLPERDAVLSLDGADQDDPRMVHVHALLAWLQEKNAAQVAASYARGGDLLIGSG